MSRTIPRPAIETRILPVISTGHISEETAKELTRQGGMKPLWCASAPWNHGYFLYLDEVDDYAPQCLRDIADWLHKHNMPGWVLLDQDAPRVDGLTYYEW